MGSYYAGIHNFTDINALRHHGVKGQVHGVRQYQNKDGSLTPLGRQHYGVGPAEGSGSDSSKQTDQSSTQSAIDKYKKSVHDKGTIQELEAIERKLKTGAMDENEAKGEIDTAVSLDTERYEAKKKKEEKEAEKKRKEAERLKKQQETAAKKAAKEQEKAAKEAEKAKKEQEAAKQQEEDYDEFADFAERQAAQKERSKAALSEISDLRKGEQDNIESGKKAFEDMGNVINQYYRDEGYESETGSNYYSKMSGKKQMTETDKKIMQIVDSASYNSDFVKARDEYYDAIAKRQTNKNPLKAKELYERQTDAYKKYKQISANVLYDASKKAMDEINKLPKKERDAAMSFAYVALGGDW